MQNPTIELENVTVSYDRTVALHGANLQVPQGSIAGIVGMNGSGKSTLFKAIMGLEKLQSGRVLIQGKSIQKINQRNLLAYIPQTEDVDWDFPISVYDVVMMGRYGYMNCLRIPRERDRQIVQQSLDRTQLIGLEHRQIGELSGGQKKRTFLARTLAQQGEIILLDEPFAGVDVKTEKAMIELLIELKNAGKTILISTHDLGSISTFCDQVILVNKTILAYGSIADVFTPENISRTFGGSVPQGLF